MRRSRHSIAATVLLLAPIMGCGMGDRIVTGFVNSSNRIYTDPTQELGDTLGRHPSVPRVTDEMLVAGFDAIRRRAADGDPQAVLILYQVAERQREKAD